MANPSSSLRGGRTRKFKSEINVVPYIDVMLVLLIIFMAAAPITNPGSVDLPSAAKSSLPPTEYIQITLKPDTSASIGIAGQNTGNKMETAGGRAELVRRLQVLHEANPTMPVMIAADKEIKYNEVIQMISEAKKLGIDRVGLSTKS
jgi:biopolymer transport protein TolR